MWDAGAVLQKRAVDGLPGPRMRVRQLLGSPGWMTGLVVTGAGWGLYVFGLQAVGVAAARTVTGGSYVLLAIFSVVFVGTRLRPAEWAAVIIVTAGVAILGSTEPGSPASPPVIQPTRVITGLSIVIAACAALLAFTLSGSRARRILPSFAAFAGLSGLLSSVGDLMVRILMTGPAPVAFAACAAGLVAFYLAGFSMLSRAYRTGTVVAGVVLSDFAARLGALLIGALALGERIAAFGGPGLERAAGFLLVLSGSVLLGRFGADARARASAETANA